MRKWILLITSLAVVMSLVACEDQDKIATLSENLKDATTQIDDHNEEISKWQLQVVELEEKLKNLEEEKAVVESHLAYEKQEKEMYSRNLNEKKDEIKLLKNRISELEFIIVPPYEVTEGYNDITLGAELEKAIGILGEPETITTEKSNEHGQFTNLTYDGVELEFLENHGLILLSITKEEELVIRDIHIGDSYVELIKQLPNKNFVTDNVAEQDYVNHLPQVTQDVEEETYTVSYSPQWGISLKFIVKDGVIIEAIFMQMYT